jgi:hypothetical protein
MGVNYVSPNVSPTRPWLFSWTANTGTLSGYWTHHRRRGCQVAHGHYATPIERAFSWDFDYQRNDGRETLALPDWLVRGLGSL